MRQSGGKALPKILPYQDNISQIAHYVIFAKLLEYSFPEDHEIILL